MEMTLILLAVHKNKLKWLMIEKLFELHNRLLLHVSSLVIDLDSHQPLRMSGIYGDQSKDSGVVLNFLYTV